MRVGEYEPVEEIGWWELGVTYRTRQRSVCRTFTLKMILSSDIPCRSETLRFRAEAGAVVNIDQPMIGTKPRGRRARVVHQALRKDCIVRSINMVWKTMKVVLISASFRITDDVSSVAVVYPLLMVAGLRSQVLHVSWTTAVAAASNGTLTVEAIVRKGRSGSPSIESVVLSVIGFVVAEYARRMPATISYDERRPNRCQNSSRRPLERTPEVREWSIDEGQSCSRTS